MKNINLIILLSIIFFYNQKLQSQPTFINYPYNSLAMQTELNVEDCHADDMHVDQDGSIIVVGTSRNKSGSKINAILLNPNGSINRKFGDNGIFEIAVDDSDNKSANTVIKVDNHFIIGGESGGLGFLLKLSVEGKPDVKFGEKGIVRTTLMKKIEAISTFHNSDSYSIIVAGSCSINSYAKPGLMCFTQNGEWNKSYGKRGIALLDHKGRGSFTDLKVSTNGHIIACGTLTKPINDYEDALVAKFNPAGEKYQSFGSGKGYVILDAPLRGFPNNAIGLEVNDRGQITICGNFQHRSEEDSYACRITYDGKLDRTFGLKKDGYYCSNYKNEADGVQSLCIQKDGKLVLGGKSNFHGDFDSNLTRLNINGLPDLSFGKNSWELIDFSSGNDSIDAMHINPDNFLYTLANSSNTSKNTIVISKLSIAIQTHPNLLDLADY